MFLQILTEHQGHLLVRAAVSIGVLAGLLLLIGFFNKRRKTTKPSMPEILNFDEQARRQSRKGRSRSNPGKRKK